MFSVTIIRGRLVDQPKIQKKVKDGKEIVWSCYRVAVNRDWKAEGREAADFYSCIAFGKRAEYIVKNGQKGTMVLISGRIKTGSYTNKANVKIPTFQLYVERQEICSGWKRSAKELAPERILNPVQDYLEMEIPEECIEDEYMLPTMD